MTNYTKSTDFAAKDALSSGDPSKVVSGAEINSEFDAIATAVATKANKASPTFTGTATFANLKGATGTTITTILDEDTMSSDSATAVPTQQSVKAYVDTQLTGSVLDFQADTGGALSIDLDSETLTLTGGTGVDTSGSGNTVTFAIDSTVATLTGTQTLSNKTIDTASNTITVVEADISDLGTTVVLDSDIGATVQAYDADTTKNDVANTFTANQTFDNGIIEEYTAVTSTTNATTVDLDDGNNFSHTLTENTTFTFSNPASTGKVSSFTLKVVQDAGASGYTVTWPTSVDWPSATAPTLTATASAVDYFVFITHDGGTTWYGFTAGQGMG